MIVSEGENGMIIGVKNSKDIVNSIITLNNDMEKPLNLSLKAKKTIMKIFDDKKYIKSLNNLYKS